MKINFQELKTDFIFLLTFWLHKGFILKYFKDFLEMLHI